MLAVARLALAALVDFPAEAQVQEARAFPSTSADSILATCSKAHAAALPQVVADFAIFSPACSAAVAAVSHKKVLSRAAISNIRLTCPSGRRFGVASCA